MLTVCLLSKWFELAADEYLAHAQQSAEAVFDHVYASLPADLVGQRDAALSQQTER